MLYLEKLVAIVIVLLVSTFGFRAIIKRYLTYKMRQMSVVYKIGKLMGNGWVCCICRGILHVLGGFWITHLLGVYLSL